MAPPCATSDLSGRLTEILNSHIDEKKRSLFFPWLFIRDHLRCCAYFVSRGVIEITPPFLPTLTLRPFGKQIKRVYLSATINSRADFTRVFGHKPNAVIAPNVDAGDGERLFVFASKYEKGALAPEVIKKLAAQTKVLIAVPSRSRGKRWDFAVLPKREDFTESLDKFRKEKTGAFVIAGRFDGIDLPGPQCRVMTIDGLPVGSNLVERYLFEKLQMDQVNSNTLSVRITQLLGRIIRGRQDFGFFLIADRTTENWLKNERNRSLLPELLRKQLFLSEDIEKQISGALNTASTIETMNKVLDRDPGWVNYYRDNIDAIDVPTQRLRDNEEEQDALEDAGRHEVRFMTKMWDNDLDGAFTELESIIRRAATYDPMLAGWYSIWAGVSLYVAGKSDAALDLFDEARHRIGRNLPLPRREVAEKAKLEPVKASIEQAIRDAAAGEVFRINDRIAKLRHQAGDAFSKKATHKQSEEAVRSIGAALGFQSSRPCTDFGKGPDVLWLDFRTKEALAFELKCDKSATSKLSKDDVGQGLNHIEWLRVQYPDIALLGLLFLTDADGISDKGSPSEKMHIGTQDQLRKLWDDFLAVIERLRVKAPLERVVEASKISELPEWSLNGMLLRLSKKKIG